MIIKTKKLTILVAVLCVTATLQAYSSDLRPGFTASLFKGIIKPSGSIISTNILSSPYAGASDTSTVVEAPEGGSQNARERFYYLNEVSPARDLSELGMEISLFTSRNNRYFLGISQSDFAIRNSIGIQYPIQYSEARNATYTRRLAVDNQHLSVGLENKLFQANDKFIITLRSALQVSNSKLKDLHLFNFDATEGSKSFSRYDQYNLEITKTYAAELGLNSIFHFNNYFNVELYAGFLLDLSRAQYQLSDRNHDYQNSDGVASLDDVWQVNDNGNATVLSASGDEYLRAKTNFTSWHVRAKWSFMF